MHLIQEELNTISREWNSHRIRQSKDCSIPAGIPNELFFLPQVQGNHHVQNCCIYHYYKVIISTYRNFQLYVLHKLQGH